MGAVVTCPPPPVFAQEAPAAQAPQVPHFAPVAAPDHVYAGGWTHFVGGGLAALDCNGDALPELFAAGGANPAQLLRNTTPAPGGALSFRVDTPKALALTGVTGAYPIDIDGDGLTDLAILRAGRDMLMRGLGDCSFALFADLGFAGGEAWTTAFSATWEAGQALPTLAFGTYVDRADPDGPFGTCDDTRLVRPDATGTCYAPPVRLRPGFCALSMLFSDWNRDGRADLRVSNDRHYFVRDGQEQMWAMEDQPRLFTEAEGWQRYSLWGMGIASRDVTGDGYPEVYLTSMGDQKFQIFDPAAGGPVWRDATYARGTTAHRPHTGGDGRPSTGWHAAFGDVNNDGRDDIFVAKGNVEQMPDAAMRDPNSLLLQQADGSFVERAVQAGVASMARGRGAVLGDLNLDGALDLAVVNRRAALEVWQNSGAPGHWLLVDLAAPGPNTAAIGAFVEVEANGQRQTREVTLGGGHAGGMAGPQHFGLGPARQVRLRVIWPGGRVGAWRTLAADQRVTLRPEATP
ncbi:CRTAC1 family protein [Pseudooceanicola aestuarii]|uniref:CRTAC1 family protein n=1 Tax=Pseudooceanicola aestuarii TaxID=2697319 RepID=UPI0013D0500C